jgi:hypothetical protein
MHKAAQVNAQNNAPYSAPCNAAYPAGTPMILQSTHPFLGLTLAVILSMPWLATAADAQAPSEVARRGSVVMPFDLAATTHVFTKTAEGGRQRVLVKQAADLGQVKRVRQHLHDIQAQFLKGDFSGPQYIHGQQMPGLAELKAAKPGQVAIDYQEVAGGAELRYRTGNADLVKALHGWFDAQLSDHGSDAMAGHQHPHANRPRP